MPGNSKSIIINRIIDANINRAKEGLRVCEEITRFILNSHNLTCSFKKIRHEINRVIKKLPANIVLIEERDSLKDVGKHIYINELKRRNCQDIFFANLGRVKESVRVLEEFSKLRHRDAALKLKKIRYGLYGIEKKAAKKIAALRYYR